MTCAICGKRRARRYCPGVRGDICAVCCGTEREVTVRCPSDCEYLMEARKHERFVAADSPDSPAAPHPEILSGEFVEEHAYLLSFLASALSAAAARCGAADSDAREALAGLIQTCRTLASGVIYESLPANPLAAALYSAMQNAAAEFQAREREALGIAKTRDSAILRALVFIQAFAARRNNGRRYGRPFLDAIARFHPDTAPGADRAGSSLILP